MNITEDPAAWGTFGDYIGGTINPALSFLSLIMLIRSVSLQNDANQDLRKELKVNEKSERTKEATTLFFSMVSAQREMFSSFEIFCNAENRNKRGTSAVIYLEDEIYDLKEEGKKNEYISQFLESKDANEQIFGILRSFYVTVRVLADRLSDERGFDSQIRQDLLRTLINFTEFGHLRLIILSMQFTTYPAAIYLKSNADFLEVVEDVGLKLDPY